MTRYLTIAFLLVASPAWALSIHCSGGCDVKQTANQCTATAKGPGPTTLIVTDDDGKRCETVIQPGASASCAACPK